MRAQVMRRDQRLACRQGQTLREVHAHQQRADQSGRVGDGDRIDVIERTIRRFDGFIHHADDRLRVPSGRDLWHNAAVELVLLHLRGDDIREDGSAVLHHSRGGLVAAAFYC